MRSDSYSRYLRSDMYKDFLNGSKKKVVSYFRSTAFVALPKQSINKWLTHTHADKHTHSDTQSHTSHSKMWFSSVQYDPSITKRTTISISSPELHVTMIVPHRRWTLFGSFDIFLFYDFCKKKKKHNKKTKTKESLLQSFLRTILQRLTKNRLKCNTHVIP